MTKAYVGIPKQPRGSGKSLSMFYDVRRHILRNSNNHYRVVSNVPFSFDIPKIDWTGNLINKTHFEAEVITSMDEYFHEMPRRTDTIFILDEAGNWIDNYSWSTIPKEFYQIIQQMRKSDLHVVYSVPRIDFVATKLRNMTECIVECQTYPKPDIDKFDRPPTPWWVDQALRTPQYYFNYVEKGITPDEKVTKELTYKYKRLYYSELKRIFPAFDTMKKVV